MLTHGQLCLHALRCSLLPLLGLPLLQAAVRYRWNVALLGSFAALGKIKKWSESGQKVVFRKWSKKKVVLESGSNCCAFAAKTVSENRSASKSGPL